MQGIVGVGAEFDTVGQGLDHQVAHLDIGAAEFCRGFEAKAVVSRQDVAVFNGAVDDVAGIDTVPVGGVHAVDVHIADGDLPGFHGDQRPEGAVDEIHILDGHILRENGQDHAGPGVGQPSVGGRVVDLVPVEAVAVDDAAPVNTHIGGVLGQNEAPPNLSVVDEPVAGLD